MYSGSRPAFDSLREAEETTRHLNAVGELLGEEGLDRFQDYVATLGERQQVGHFSARLGVGNELRPDQEERLIALLREQTLRTMETTRTSRWLPRILKPRTGAPPIPK